VILEKSRGCPGAIGPGYPDRLQMARIEKYRPAARNSSLILLSGIVWIGVGIMLLCFAFSWLAMAQDKNIYFFACSGVIAALIVHHFGFLKIVNTNIERIFQTNEKKCLFSFIPSRSYLIIAVMITLGVILRHSSIPKQYLSILYIGIGLALILSSVRYLRIFFREIRKIE
jgi:hypothetical protein